MEISFTLLLYYRRTNEATSSFCNCCLQQILIDPFLHTLFHIKYCKFLCFLCIEYYRSYHFIWWRWYCEQPHTIANNHLTRCESWILGSDHSLNFSLDVFLNIGKQRTCQTFLIWRNTKLMTWTLKYLTQFRINTKMLLTK